jgi:ring-1,2-phenylacetyl-CoA epoxidase subunit PaaE
MLEFNSLLVTAVERTAEDAACLTLAIPPALRAAYAFDAGQYVTVRRRIAGRDERRSYSIVSAPGAAELKLGIRLQPGGRMSAELGSSLRPRELLEVGTPMGRFCVPASVTRARSYVAFAAGSGITPILSLATDILRREPRSRMTLVYGNQNVARTMFLEETLALKNRHMGRFAVHFLMSREPQHADLLNGRIDGDKVRELARHFHEVASADEYLVCGPGDMVEAVRDTLEALNPEAKVRFERFAPAAPRPPDMDMGIGTSTRASAGAPPAAAEVLATITIVMDGRRRTFPMAVGDASVLDAGERAGLELPFSCRAGICATCRTRVTEGAAVMMHNIALEPWETERGFVLCCQARPTTPTLELSYDYK